MRKIINLAAQEQVEKKVDATMSRLTLQVKTQSEEIARLNQKM